MTFVKDGALAHTSKAGSDMVSEEFAKDDWPANSPHLNRIEIIWSLIYETTYKDPAPKTLDELRKRLRFALKNVTPDTLKEFVHSMSRRLENVRKNKGGHSGY